MNKNYNKGYYLKMTEHQKAVIRTISNNIQRENLESFYGYLLNCNQGTNAEFRRKGVYKQSDLLKTSLGKLSLGYAKNNRLVSKPIIKKWLDKLIELGLITVTIIKRETNILFHKESITMGINRVENESVNNSKNPASVENTNLEDNSNQTPYTLNSLYNNNINTTSKIATFEEVEEVVVSTLKELNIKNKEIRNTILGNMKMYLENKNIDKAGLKSFVLVAIEKVVKAKKIIDEKINKIKENMILNGQNEILTSEQAQELKDTVELIESSKLNGCKMRKKDINQLKNIVKKGYTTVNIIPAFDYVVAQPKVKNIFGLIDYVLSHCTAMGIDTIHIENIFEAFGQTFEQSSYADIGDPCDQLQALYN